MKHERASEDCYWNIYVLTLWLPLLTARISISPVPHTPSNVAARWHRARTEQNTKIHPGLKHPQKNSSNARRHPRHSCNLPAAGGHLEGALVRAVHAPAHRLQVAEELLAHEAPALLARAHVRHLRTADKLQAHACWTCPPVRTHPASGGGSVHPTPMVV